MVFLHCNEFIANIRAFFQQEIYPIFPPLSVSSNIDNIRDTEIGHVDLEDFLKRVRESLVSYLMEPIINSEIHLVVAFPNPKFVLALANWYDSSTRSVKDTDGKKTLIKIDEDFFYTIFKFSPIDQYVDIDMQSAVAYLARIQRSVEEI